MPFVALLAAAPMLAMFVITACDVSARLHAPVQPTVTEIGEQTA